ncbi:hypothetical protein K440DRAFT_308410 [Wilcoxina mikolae CBS 423.85]|nr:hypothetical protein K440DRAFT_308410 [Wilcoxina mikolae CBS 423.85]
MVTDMNDISRASASLGASLSRMQNLPAVDNGVQVIARLDALLINFANFEQRVAGRFDEVNRNIADVALRLSASDFNNVARLENSRLVTTRQSVLSPLRTPLNENVEDFPATFEQLENLNAVNINRLLTTYGLPTNGNVDDRRRRLRKHLGLHLLN